MSDYEHKMRVWETFNATKMSAFTAHIGSVSTFASIAINSLVLLNSASVGAVLTLIGAVWDKKSAASIVPKAVLSIEAFVCGAGLAIICAGFSYVSQFLYMEYDKANIDVDARNAMSGTKDPRVANCVRWIGTSFQGLAILAAISSFVFFSIGAARGVSALGAANLNSSQESCVAAPWCPACGCEKDILKSSLAD